jgi:hypothetical protein
VAVIKELLIGEDEQHTQTVQIDSTSARRGSQAFFICPDGSAVDSLYVSDNGRPRLVTAEELCKPTFEDIVRSVDPGASTKRFFSVYPDWKRGKASRTLAQAQEIAAAIVAEFGGSVEVVRFEKHPGQGTVDVDTCATHINVFYDSEEAPPCSAS